MRCARRGMRQPGHPDVRCAQAEDRVDLRRRRLQDPTLDGRQAPGVLLPGRRPA